MSTIDLVKNKINYLVDYRLQQQWQSSLDVKTTTAQRMDFGLEI